MLNTEILYTGSFLNRVLRIEIQQKSLVSPTYFPSISSAATRLQLAPLIRTCITSGYPRLLISAYDLFHLSQENYNSISKLLINFSKENNFLFIDSGTFESYWLQDGKWDYVKYESMIKKNNCDFFTSFDDIPNPHDDYNDIFKTMYQNTKKSTKLTNKNHCVCICHGQTPAQLCDIIKDLSSNELKFCRMIAIPERDCGKTIDDKIETVQKIKKILEKDDNTNVLHILGCGNPISIALFSFAGADSFDSIDWSRWLIDKNTLKIMDSSHLSLIDCSCKVCAIPKMDPTVRVLLHNLLFYQQFMLELQKTIIQKNEINFLEKYCDQKTISKIVSFF